MSSEPVEQQGYQSETVYVVMVMPYSDGSGTAEIIGVYTDEIRAQACAYRSIIEEGHQPMYVVVRPLVLND